MVAGSDTERRGYGRGPGRPGVPEIEVVRAAAREDSHAELEAQIRSLIITADALAQVFV